MLNTFSMQLFVQKFHLVIRSLADIPTQCLLLLVYLYTWCLREQALSRDGGLRCHSHYSVRSCSKQACRVFITRSCRAELILGALAGAMGQVFTIPVSVVATRQQLHETGQSLFTTTKEILQDDGLFGLWRGLKASLVLTVVRAASDCCLHV